MSHPLEPSGDDVFALQVLIDRFGGPPPPPLEKPTPQAFDISAAELARMEKAEAWHKRTSSRTTLGCVVAILVFAAGSAVVLLVSAIFDSDGFVWALLVAAYFAALCLEGTTEAVLRWKSGRNPYRRSGLPRATIVRMLAFRAAESQWIAAEATRIESWKTTVRARALAQLQRDKSVQRLRASFWKGLTGLAFERELGEIYRRLGYTVKQTKATGDGGVDLILEQDSKRIVVQCKQHSKPAGPSFVRDLYGTMMHRGATSGILACTSGFSGEARKFAHGKPLSLIGLSEILLLAEAADAKKP